MYGCSVAYQVEEERSSLSGQSSELQSDLHALRKELVGAEQARMALHADNSSLHEKITFLEADREKVELELRQLARSVTTLHIK